MEKIFAEAFDSAHRELAFKPLFDTQDLNKSQSDTNSGIWKIYNVVSFAPAGTPNFQIGRATVEVLDPGATPQLPEPSTLLLFASGLAGLAGLRRKQPTN